MHRARGPRGRIFVKAFNKQRTCRCSIHRSPIEWFNDRLRNSSHLITKHRVTSFFFISSTEKSARLFKTYTFSRFLGHSSRRQIKTNVPCESARGMEIELLRASIYAKHAVRWDRNVNKRSRAAERMNIQRLFDPVQ